MREPFFYALVFTGVPAAPWKVTRYGESGGRYQTASFQTQPTRPEAELAEYAEASAGEADHSLEGKVVDQWGTHGFDAERREENWKRRMLETMPESARHAFANSGIDPMELLDEMLRRKKKELQQSTKSFGSN